MPPKKKIIINEEDKVRAEQQIKQIQKEVNYDLRDFTIGYIVQEFNNDRFYIPDYQRKFIWNEPTRVKFIESVILGLPIPLMFVADTDDGRLEIVDGAQRIQTLESFINNDLQLNKMEQLSLLEGFKFDDLPISQKRKFENRAIRLIVLEDKTSLELRQEIFNRINTSGKKVNPTELRKGAYSGPFMSFINNCATNQLFLDLCPMSPSLINRGEAQELILRFFAYSDRYQMFTHDVAKFLDEYVITYRDTFEEERLSSEFNNMLNFVSKYFQCGFAKSENANATPRVRFEAIAVGVNLALKKKQNLIPNSLSWLDSEEFKQQTTTHASNSGPRLRNRIEFVRDNLLLGANHARSNK